MPAKPKLFEQYRPRRWSEVVGQSAAIERLRCIAQRSLGSRPFWIAGPSGTGKTTIARLLAAEIADPDFVLEFDAGELTVGLLADLERQSHLWGGGQHGGRAYIVNEAHGLRKDAIRRLLVVLEAIPRHVVWIFTTTKAGQDALFEDSIDADPLLSRCERVDLAAAPEAFAVRAREIAQAEGLNGAPPDAYAALAARCKGNMRAMLNEIESGAMLAEGGKP